MSYQLDRNDDTNGHNAVASGRNGPNIALILGVVVAVLTLVFFFRNSQPVKLNFLVFTKTSTVRWSIFVAILLGVLLDRLFSIWWRRRRRD